MTTLEIILCIGFFLIGMNVGVIIGRMGWFYHGKQKKVKEKK